MSRTANAAAAERLDDLTVAEPGADPDAFARTVVRSTSAALMMVALPVATVGDSTTFRPRMAAGISPR